jgi:hypothetical protein
MTDLDHHMDRLTVAAQIAVAAYGDLVARGYDKEPNLVAASLNDIEWLVRELRTAGFGADGNAGMGEVELIEETFQFDGHTCTCEYCPHCAPRPDRKTGGRT